ncbi:MAG: hypothetical protein MZV70_58025 [Desulfobacterales bacterium]|nr:hypothetical protein [Desulfobacterales bacterium]
MTEKYYVFFFKEEKLPGKDEWEKEKEGYKRYVLSKGQGEFSKILLWKRSAKRRR